METILGLMKDVVYRCMAWICRLVTLIPRREELWVFGAWKGKLYADNAKYMFEYVNREHPQIRAVWIARDRAVVREVRAKGYQSYANHSLMGIFLCLRAGVALMTEDTHDISKVLISGSKMIQLWHGMGIKDVRKFVQPDISRARAHYLKYAHPYERQYWMTACRDAAEKYARAFGVPPEQMFITGQPKDDNFVVCGKNAMVEEIRARHPGATIYVYLPTHRNFGQGDVCKELTYEAFARLNTLLREKQIVMIFKPHTHEFAHYRGKTHSLSNIVFATDPEAYGDVYAFLPMCDGLITDYSGVMLGYLTGRKPIVYVPFDMDEYLLNDAGFCFRYEEVTAGPICKTWEEVVRAIDAIRAEDTYKQRREELRKRFSPYNDGRNCQRVYQEIQSILHPSN